MNLDFTKPKHKPLVMCYNIVGVRFTGNLTFLTKVTNTRFHISTRSIRNYI